MCVEAFVDGYTPGRVGLEKFDHISLQIPNDDFRVVLAAVDSLRVLLIHTLVTLLELMGQWDLWIFYLRHTVFARFVSKFAQMLLPRD